MPEDFYYSRTTNDQKAIMKFQHRSLPIYGFPYHQKVSGRQMGSDHRKFLSNGQRSGKMKQVLAKVARKEWI